MTTAESFLASQTTTSLDATMAQALGAAVNAAQSPPGLPDTYTNRALGIGLAVLSSVLIGVSFVLKKKGLLSTNYLSKKSGSGHAYLRSRMWWFGMTVMALGEAANFMAYSFTPAVIVAPLGALSVVITTALSSFMLKERLNLSGKIGCAQCLLGAITIVLHAPEGNSTRTISEFVDRVVDPFFIAYAALLLTLAAYLAIVQGRRVGDRYPIVYISVCSLIGALVVLASQGFGSAIVFSLAHPHQNQFLDWRMYIVMLFLAVSLAFEIHFLNKALNLFSTAIVTPIYYVFFTAMTLVSSAVLFRASMAGQVSNVSIVTIVIAFLSIVGGVMLLFQYSVKLHRAEENEAKRALQAHLLETQGMDAVYNSARNGSATSSPGLAELGFGPSPPAVNVHSQLHQSATEGDDDIAHMHEPMCPVHTALQQARLKNHSVSVGELPRCECFVVGSYLSPTPQSSLSANGHTTGKFGSISSSLLPDVVDRPAGDTRTRPAALDAVHEESAALLDHDVVIVPLHPVESDLDQFGRGKGESATDQHLEFGEQDDLGSDEDDCVSVASDKTFEGVRSYLQRVFGQTPNVNYHRKRFLAAGGHVSPSTAENWSRKVSRAPKTPPQGGSDRHLGADAPQPPRPREMERPCNAHVPRNCSITLPAVSAVPPRERLRQPPTRTDSCSTTNSDLGGTVSTIPESLMASPQMSTLSDLKQLDDLVEFTLPRDPPAISRTAIYCRPSVLPRHRRCSSSVRETRAHPRSHLWHSRNASDAPLSPPPISEGSSQQRPDAVAATPETIAVSSPATASPRPDANW